MQTVAAAQHAMHSRRMRVLLLVAFLSTAPAPLLLAAVPQAAASSSSIIISSASPPSVTAVHACAPCLLPVLTDDVCAGVTCDPPTDCQYGTSTCDPDTGSCSAYRTHWEGTGCTDSSTGMDGICDYAGTCQPGKWRANLRPRTVHSAMQACPSYLGMAPAAAHSAHARRLHIACSAGCRLCPPISPPCDAPPRWLPPQWSSCT